MLLTVFGCFRTSRHLFVKHVSTRHAFIGLFLLCCTADTLLAIQHHAQQQRVTFPVRIMLDRRFVRVLPVFFLCCREIRSNGEHLSCDN